MRINNNKKHNIKINYNIKINDKNIEPCEYCNEEPTIIRPENLFNNHLKFQIFNKYIYLVDYKYRIVERFEINHCPMCGRKLNDNKEH